MRLLLVGNPASGSGRGQARLRDAAAALRLAGAAVEIHASRGPGDVESLLSGDLGGADRVVACGGDGLVSEAARALSGRDVPLAVIPAGRGNDLARGLGIPLAAREACVVAAGGRVEAIDLGDANGRAFCTVAACGIDAEVSRAARTSPLPLPGALGYGAGLLRQLPRFPHWRLRVRADDRLVEEPALAMAVANTPAYGGGFLIAPAASPRDGLLDACFVRAVGRMRALCVAARALRGRHADMDEVLMLRAARIEVDAEPALIAEADGESLAATPIVFTVRRGALRVVTP